MIRSKMCSLIVFFLIFGLINAQDLQESKICYGPGSIALSILLTFFLTLLLIGAILYYLKKRSAANLGNHLILETDPEQGRRAEFAFDNPGFKDATLIVPSSTTNLEKTKPEQSRKSKWTQWANFSELTLKSEKKRVVDDLVLQDSQINVVALKSQDFTGLGFQICGNMKEGIYIKDILHRGPAFESGKLHSGDRIQSVTISFEHMVYEDALNILSYASPYEVTLTVKTGRPLLFSQPPLNHVLLVHPIFKSASLMDLSYSSAKKKLFPAEDYSSSSNYSSLQKSRSNVTTLERKESKSPRPIKVQNNSKKNQSEIQRISEESSPKIFEQNQNNANIIKDDNLIKPLPKKREKKSPEPELTRIFGSGIKRDENNIPLELPVHLQDVAIMAKRNRKNNSEIKNNNEETTPRKIAKGKAPSPPAVSASSLTLTKAFPDLTVLLGSEDSGDDDDEKTQQIIMSSSGNPSEEINNDEEKNKQARKTASMGDLSKMMKPTFKLNSPTLERAQSLDITDTGVGLNLTKTSNYYDAQDNLLIDREPRLSLVLDGLSTFQRNCLKNSTEWGKLEDAILNFNNDNCDNNNDDDDDEPHFNAVIDKVIEIKRECVHHQETDADVPDEIILAHQHHRRIISPEINKVLNKIWPDEDELINGSAAEQPKPQERTRISKNKEKISSSSLLNQPNSTIQVEYECIKPAIPKRERCMTPSSSMENNTTVINLNNKISKISPVTTFEKANIEEMCAQIAKGRTSEPMIKDEWEEMNNNNNNNNNSTPSTSSSLTFVDEVMESLNNNNNNNNNNKNITIIQTNNNTEVNKENGENSSTLHSLELSINNNNNADDQINSEISNIDDAENDEEKVHVTEITIFEEITQEKNDNKLFKGIEDESPVLSLIDEIIENEKDTTTADQNNKSFITEIQVSEENNLENAFENYVKNFEKKSLESFETTTAEVFVDKLLEHDVNIEKNSHNGAIITNNNNNNDVVKEVNKIQELAEEQLRTLPEMRFSTSSYEGRKTPEKRNSFELLRSSFEKTDKTPQRRDSKSRIPISTTMKTPPMSPERRDSRNLENENDQALLELISSTNNNNVPATTTFTSKIKPPGTKNISVTSIKNSSKIPSGLPTFNSNKPPIPPRKNDENNIESSFKQWVFNPNNNNNNVSNITVIGKEK